MPNDYTLEYDSFTRRWHWQFLDDGAMARCGNSRTEAEARRAIDDARADYFDEPRPSAGEGVDDCMSGRFWDGGDNPPTPCGECPPCLNAGEADDE